MRILCLGDSNTWGYDPRGYWGGRYDAPWPEELSELTGWEVINLGENGRQIPGTAADLPAGDLLLVMLGTNDLLQGASAAAVGERMEAFLAQGHFACPRVILICPPSMKRGAWVAADALVEESHCLGTEYEALAGRLDIGFVDTRTWEIPMTFDGVHFTQEGHRIFAEQLKGYL